MGRTGILSVLEESDKNIKDKLLELIEEGDATVILSSEYAESLNELIKHEFVSIGNDKLKLTEKGLQAKVLGVKGIMDRTIPVKEEIIVNELPQQKINSVISNGSFLIILFFFLVSLLALLTVTNLQ